MDNHLPQAYQAARYYDSSVTPSNIPKQDVYENMSLYQFCQRDTVENMATSIWSRQNQLLQQTLKELRVGASLTQLQLAEKLMKPQSYVSKYESGERRLDLIELKEIAESCDVTLNDLVIRFELKISKGK